MLSLMKNKSIIQKRSIYTNMYIKRFPIEIKKAIE